MPFEYPVIPLPDSAIPAPADPSVLYLLQTYTSEINKTHSIITAFSPDHLELAPHQKSATVGEVIRHIILSEHHFFANFLSCPAPNIREVLPTPEVPATYAQRLVDLAKTRLEFLAAQTPEWWQEVVPFFDTDRPRNWIFLRNLLHCAHHRTQLTTCQRLLNLPLKPLYGPTADSE